MISNGFVRSSVDVSFFALLVSVVQAYNMISLLLLKIKEEAIS